MSRRAYVVVDLGFGDAGKGLLTDYLARQHDAGVVVRYNGSAQAGHNVVMSDGRQHTFSQFGSGTFIPNVKTFLAKQVVIDPLALLVEGEVLEKKGITDAFERLRVSDQALVITPFQRAANRLRELARGANRHGSCGVGVGETVADSLAAPQTRIVAGELKHPNRLWQKLRASREMKRAQILAFCEAHAFDPSARPEFEVFNRDDLMANWIAAVNRVNQLDLVAPNSTLKGWLQAAETVIFEGAQGVLLDANAGFHPYTTWSRCTTANALALIGQYIPKANVQRIGVLRAYAVRHGPGPLPTETNTLAALISEHNQLNDWQGAVRYGWFDAVLARYALAATGGVDTLAITHLDILPHLDAWSYCRGYRAKNQSENYAAGRVDAPRVNGLITDFSVPDDLSQLERQQVSQWIGTVTPVVETCLPDTKKVIKKIEQLAGQQVGMVSFGPKAEDVQILAPHNFRLPRQHPKQSANSLASTSEEQGKS